MTTEHEREVIVVVVPRRRHFCIDYGPPRPPDPWWKEALLMVCFLIGFAIPAAIYFWGRSQGMWS